MNETPDITAIGIQLQRLATATARDALPALIGAIEAAKAIAWGRLSMPAAEAHAVAPDVASMTAGELAALYHVPRSFFYELARQNRVPCMRLGRYVRFSRPYVERALSEARNSKTTALEPRLKRRRDADLRDGATAMLPRTASRTEAR